MRAWLLIPALLLSAFHVRAEEPPEAKLPAPLRQLGQAAADLRILYGGSGKPDNAKVLMAEEEIDGVLVGGASLDPQSFATIVKS